MADRIVVMEGGRIQQVGTPAEISKRPANVFVAAFMGDNNILRGSVKEIRDGQVIIDASIGHLAMPAPAQSTHNVGDDITVAVRASSVHLTPSERNGQPNQLSCTVGSVEYLGDIVKVHMRAGEHTVLAKLPEERYSEMVALTGQPVLASWNSQDVQLLRD